MTDFRGLVSAGIQGLTPYQPGKPVEELQRELGLDSIIKLASNENPLGPAPAVRRAIEAASADLSRYPDGNGFGLKQTLAQRHQIDAEQITLGNGSNDVLDLIARVFLGNGRSAVFSQYAFAVYPLSTLAAGGRPLAAAATDDYGHDLTAMRALVDEQTGVVFIANPNNPTGTMLAGAPLREFVASLPSQVVVVIDEAYFEYVEHADYPDTISWLQAFPNLVVTRTFSKAYGLAGLRVGYALSNGEIADLLNRVRQPFNVNSLALVAAETALQETDHLARAVDLNNRELQRVGQRLTELGLHVIPSVGNFICVDVGREAASVYDGMLRLGVIVRPVDNYGLPTHLRISLGLEAENNRCVDALASVLDRKLSA
ncbi:MAG TPA: histidinol-phosphate transaminase [Chromatiales bacterium]|nr:histidinol-phosphate transaminase [Chromatiales bacterium]